jgi:IclR family acetate operon transcriptional repressor
MTQETPPIRTTKTTIRVIEALNEFDGVGVSDLADYLDIPTSTAFDHLRTLEQCELVVKNGQTYEIGTRFLEFGGYARSTNEVYRTALPEIRKLARRTGEHANLMIEEFGEGVFFAKATGEEAFQLDTHIGKRVHLQTTALGKAILAFLPDDRVDEILETRGLPEITRHTVTNREKLLEELDTVRENGYATDDEERILGVRCVAAPVKHNNKNVLAAVSVSGAKSGMQGDRFRNEIPELVQRAANVIEVNLKYK